MTRTTSTLLAALTVLLSPLAANADFITFGEGAGINTLGYTEGDLTISSIGFECQLRDWPTSSSAGCTAAEGDFGERELLAFNSSAPIVFSSVSGSPFDLLGLDVENPAGIIGFSSIDFFDVIGSNGTIVTLNSEDFSNQSFANSFLGIDWFALQCNDSDTTCQFTVDNIEYTPGVSVPEPGTLALFGIGLLGIGASRRRRKA
ncbi:MAG: PEP-CTERM sorting domain-containing protein [Gammaproteobacteria bacterium]|nr:PEP-CTERM sorting domain-containing protein [Gammaproteobacteria bacterium]